MPAKLLVHQIISIAHNAYWASRIFAITKDQLMNGENV